MVKDPVCGMDVTPDTDVARADGADVGRPGTTLYFCSPLCRTTFLKEPEKFLAGTKVPMAAMQRRALLYWTVLLVAFGLGIVLVFLIFPGK